MLPRDGPLPPERTPPPDADEWLIVLGWYLARLAAVAAGLTAVIYGYQILLGSSDPAHPNPLTPHFPWRYFEYGAVFLTAVTLFRGRREVVMAAVALPCLHHLYVTCPQLVPYMAALIPALYWLLGREDRPGPTATRRFWWGIGLGVVLLPKCIEAFWMHYEHGTWLDLNQNVFMGLFLRYAYYYYERRQGLVPAGRFWEHVAYLLFVPQITGMLNLAALGDVGAMGVRVAFAGSRICEHRLGAGEDSGRSCGWSEACCPRGATAGATRRCEAAPRCGGVDMCLLSSYLYWALLVSAKFDLMAALFRFFGVDVDDNFRWPLLATSPIGLWRRWNVYNRRLLLKFVYFPLGGNRRWVYRNILCTFLASALLLHTGWLGSPWWGVRPGAVARLAAVFRGAGRGGCARRTGG